jgi:hypothetical protein
LDRDTVRYSIRAAFCVAVADDRHIFPTKPIRERVCFFGSEAVTSLRAKLMAVAVLKRFGDYWCQERYGLGS